MSAPEEIVKIKLTGRLQFEDEITLSQAAQIIAFIGTSAPTGTASILAAPHLGPAGLGRTGTTATPRGALEASGAKTNPEKIVAFALHVAQDGAKETFSLEDVRPLFRRARESSPGNLNRDLDAAIKAGWIAEAETKGEFYVTEKASRVLESGFDSIRSKASGGKTGGKTTSTSKKARKPTATPDVFRALDAISPTLEGYIGYHKLKKKTDRFLWAVNYAKVSSIPALTNQELAWLTDALGAGIEAKDIGAYFNSNRKAGYVNRSTQDSKIRMTPDGETYLKTKSVS